MNSEFPAIIFTPSRWLLFVAAHDGDGHVSLSKIPQRPMPAYANAFIIDQ